MATTLLAPPDTVTTGDDELAHIKRLSLYERLLAIQEAIGHVYKPIPGLDKGQRNEPALSIEGFEAIVGPLFAQYRVLTIPAESSSESYQEPGKDGKPHTQWKTRLVIEFVNMDNPDERIKCVGEDTGTSPTAAGSFVVKAIYRRIFHVHLANERRDEQGGRGRGAPSVPSQQQLEELAGLASDLGVAVPRVDTAGEAAEAIGRLRRERDTRKRDAEQRPATPASSAPSKEALRNVLVEIARRKHYENPNENYLLVLDDWRGKNGIKAGRSLTDDERARAFEWAKGELAKPRD